MSTPTLPSKKIKQKRYKLQIISSKYLIFPALQYAILKSLQFQIRLIFLELYQFLRFSTTDQKISLTELENIQVNRNVL